MRFRGVGLPADPTPPGELGCRERDVSWPGAAAGGARVPEEERGPDPALPGKRAWGRKEPAGRLAPCQQKQRFWGGNPGPQPAWARPQGHGSLEPELPPSEFMQVADSTWLVLSVVSNGRAPSGCQATGVTKIARSVIAPLAEHHVSVLMLSTYQTDFVLVRERDLPVVIHTLAGEFDIYKEENGESVPVTCDDASNGFLKPKAATSPTLHPVQSPQNRFCILTVAPDTLPAIATMLIDVLFYSHRWVTRVGTSSAAVPQLGVTPLHLAPCGFPSSGCVFAKCCCSLEHAARGRCVSCCHSWELEPPSPGVTVLGDKPRIAAKQRGAGQRWLRCAGAVHGNILGTALWDRPLQSHHGALGMPPNPLFLRPTDWWDTNPYRAPPAAPPRSPVLVARTST
uniref:Cytosolic arginine sensor for mTORC1 subunit 1 n=1 Tax=Anas platyrhynchos platyrhynchos TaxID=8840 RepID=A0A493TG22_ANAPP